ncbi:MAG: glycoside hydrolase family 3 C-terminal domain-containing protein [Bacteroidaceae bacterium]|nr:glycoside hydrolase family 3 C-terminal domain-containing protein [Bacteroidaceae bacterium]
MQRLRLLGTLFALLIACVVQGQSSIPAYRNPELSPRERAVDLCARLSLSEKVSLMEHESSAIERLGIPAFNWWSEALHGVGRNGLATVFPITMGLASTWDDALVQRCFDAVSTEARAKNNTARHEGHAKIYECLSFWTPNINIFRDPRWGRGQETYGEDPYLTGRMGLAVVRGLQGAGSEGRYQKLLACGKHFAVHSGPEWSRHRMNVDDVPLRDLWETYLPAFKTLVQEGHVAEIMCAYQRLDGEPCCGSARLLQQILRKEWGFDGLVTSDCWAVNDFWQEGRHGFSASKVDAVSHAVRSGTDVECGVTFRTLEEGVREGKVTEAEIDTSLIRLLTARFLIGDFDDEALVSWKRIGPEVVDCGAHRQLALEAARRSIVLLQNRDGILPLNPEEKILVVGQNATDSTMQWGNYNGFPSHTETILSALKRRVGSVDYVDCPLVADPSKSATVDEADILNKVRAHGDADVVVFVGGISPRLEGEEMKVEIPGFHGGDRTDIELPDVQRRLMQQLHADGKKVVFVCCSGSAIALEPETVSCDGIVQVWYGGQSGGTAVAEVLFGDYCPGGKLPVTFYRNTAQLPDYEDYHMQGRTYRYMQERPLWPFGYGLSYTSFRLSRPKLKNDVLSVTVKNTGRMDGDEVVQVYLRRVGDDGGPVRALRDFRRVSVPAGKKVRVDIPLDDKTFEWWNPETNTMGRVPGDYEIQVGTSSRAEDLQTIRVTRR